MKFDVFVSYRGIDTRRTFVSHLLLALFKQQFKTFRQEEEEEEIPWNQPASSQVLEAIENSKIAILVISRNYTASVSCLDELTKIIECKEKQSLVMIPVLYEVDTSDVLGQTQNLGEHIYGHSNNNLETVERWRNALTSMIETYQEVYSHWEDGDSSEDEDTDAFIIFRVMLHVSKRLKPPEKKEESITVYLTEYKPAHLIPDSTGFLTKGIWLVRAALSKIVWRILYAETLISFVNPARSSAYVHKDKYDVTSNELSQLVPSIDFDSLVGMDRQMKAVESLLLDMDSEEDGLGEMGIWGEERLGKTTLARCVYQNVSPQFQDHYYFEYVTPNSSSLGIGTSTCLLEEIARSALPEKKIPDEVVKLESERFGGLANASLGHRKVVYHCPLNYLAPSYAGKSSVNGNSSYVDLKHRRIAALQKFLAIWEIPSLEEDGFAFLVCVLSVFLLFLVMFPTGRCQYLGFDSSDHRPVLTVFDSGKRKSNRLFRYDRRLRDNEIVKGLIAEVCNDNSEASVDSRLALCRRAISTWTRKHYFNSKEEIHKLKQKLDVVMSDPHGDENLIKSLNLGLMLAYKAEEEFWRQRSRIIWLALGDKNSGYFHAIAKGRRARNRMTVIEDAEGRAYYEEEQIAGQIAGYFSDIYSSESTPTTLATTIEELS
ncbi:Toll/interleukin-1 receptor homology (TIR) domain-containing protein [Hirschfeldia incana]|nr:Toll/interleukin-1 receptor homology (TIR) domain-containing protein [Hirschfeldia incana]